MLINQAFNNEPATVKGFGLAFMGTNKTPHAWVDFSFDGIRGDNDEEVTVKAYLWLTDAALEGSLERLKTLGWAGSSFAELDPEVPGHFDFVGRKAYITGEIETYEGKLRPKVKFINSEPYSGGEPMNKDSVKYLDQKLKAKVLAFRLKNGKPTTTKSKKTEKVEADTVPF